MAEDRGVLGRVVAFAFNVDWDGDELSVHFERVVYEDHSPEGEEGDLAQEVAQAFESAVMERIHDLMDEMGMQKGVLHERAAPTITTGEVVARSRTTRKTRKTKAA
jgi:hypothetical protein